MIISYQWKCYKTGFVRPGYIISTMTNANNKTTSLVACMHAVTIEGVSGKGDMCHFRFSIF